VVDEVINPDDLALLYLAAGVWIWFL